MSESIPDLYLRAYGRTISLSGPAAAMTAVRERLPPTYRVATGPGERHWEVVVGPRLVLDEKGNLVPAPPDDAAAAEAVLSDLELWVAAHARRNIFVHAGCVAVDGRAIVFPGRSMSGKSSLTAALVRAGADYYSDEYAVFDHRGVVRPYSRMLGIRPYGSVNPERVSVEEFGGKAGRGPALVAVVAVLQYDADAGWQPETITRGQAIIRLFDNTVAARSRPTAALNAIEAATLDASFLAGTRGDADETAEMLLHMLGS